jgi:hypothetical protein
MPGVDTAALLESLIQDAKLVASQVQRTGKLKDHELFKAIAAVDALPTHNWSQGEILKLQEELDKAIPLIAPATVRELRSDWDERDPWDHAKQYGFVLAALVLMIITAFSTWEYNRGSLLISGIEALEREKPRTTIASLVRQILAVQTARTQSTPSTPVIDPTTGAVIPASTSPNTDTTTNTLLDEPYYALIDRLHEVDNELAFYMPLASEFLASHLLPIESIQAVGRGFVASFVPAASATPASSIDTSAAGYGEYNACAGRDKSPALYLTATFANTPLAAELTHNYYSYLDVICGEELYISRSEKRLVLLPTLIDNLRNWATIWGEWFLPGLYGALGAVLYYMRRILDPNVPDPPLSRVLHRMFLGSFAGIIVTWFWAPDLKIDDAGSVGLTTFTLAFLVGFGIEVLFSLLDRLVGTLSEAARGASAK